MDFKLFAKRKEIVEGEPKETMLQSMKAGLDYLRLQPVLMAIIWVSLIHQLPVRGFHGRLCIYSNRKNENGAGTLWIN